MGSLGDGVKKVLLAGIGTVAVTAEKSKEVLDKMAERGEAAVEQGKVLNQELRHNIKKLLLICLSSHALLSGHLHRKNWMSCLTR